MKRVLTVFVCVVMVLSLSSCACFLPFGAFLNETQSEATVEPLPEDPEQDILQSSEPESVYSEPPVESIEPVEPSSAEPSSAEPSSVEPSSIEPSSEAPQNNSLVYPEVIYEYGYHCTVNADGGLNLRYGPGKQYESILVIPNGSALVEMGYQDNWIFVNYNGQNGWVSAEFVLFDEAMGMAKPVIYLYPETKTDVSVFLEIENGELTCTYPAYNNGWKVTAYPDGTIINKADNREYSYLYWEADSNTHYDMSEGFVVKGEDTAQFLQETLAKMGLTPREYNEFIVYWLPLMQDNAYNYITFQNKAYTDAAKLNINPEPDSLLRVFMVYKPLEKPIKCKQPVIDKFERKGFTVVEWGGTEIK